MQASLRPLCPFHPLRPLRLPTVLLVTLLAAVPVHAEDRSRFAIRDFDVSGNTLLNQDELDAALAGAKGEGRDSGDLRRAVEALRAAYARKGYRAVTVSLPEQAVDQGRIKIQVKEYTLDKVEVDVPEGMDPARVRAWFPMLAAGSATDFKRLGRALDVINESPSLNARVDMTPGASEQAQAARIKVTEEHPFAGFATLDNTGSHNTGNHRLSLGMRDGNLSGNGQSLSAQYVTSPDKASKVAIWGISHRLPMPEQGMAIETYAGHSDVDSGTVASVFTVAGKGTVAGTKAVWALDRDGPWRQKASVGVDYRAFRNSVLTSGISGSVVPDYSIHPVSVGYEFSNGGNGGYLTAFQGFGGDGKDADAQIRTVRAGARASYFLLRYGFSWGSALPAGWGFDASLSGQWSRDPLVPGEQFGLGGAQNVRGFEERYIAGDNAHRVSLQLWAPTWTYAESVLRPLAFIDWGNLRRNNPQVGELPLEGIASAGLGLRASMGSHVSLGWDLARVIQGTVGQNAGNVRNHVSLAAQF